MRRRSFWAWGYEGEGLDRTETEALGGLVAARLGVEPPALRDPPSEAGLRLRPPRVGPPRRLEAICSTTPYDRALHAYGRSFRDVVRGFEGRYPHPPDVVAHPASEADLERILEWCGAAGLAAIPYGGGSSVSGGVEPDCDKTHAGAVSVDLGRLDRVLEVDGESLAARVQAGILGPALEEALRPRGLTLRHFPQSFEVSSLGGWIATRSAGHYATGPTRIDDRVESVRALTPRGVLESRRVPGSGAGPEPNRMLLGSEGILGFITEAWVRLQERPRFRAAATAEFETFEAGCAAAKALAQSGLLPANCRLLDPEEALVSGSGSGDRAILLVGFESADHAVDHSLERAVEICREAGGEIARRAPGQDSEGAAGAWRSSFIRAPYLRDALVALGLIVETFETAVTWERFSDLHAGVVGAVRAGLREAGCRGWVSCRLTHAYPDGPAPYYSVVASGPGDRIPRWQAVKDAALEAILAAGGAITHHHAIGRDHRPGYEREVPELFRAALRAAKDELDPFGVMNPGALLG